MREPRPQLEFHRIGLEPFQALGAIITPIRLEHGPRFKVLGYRVGNVAYCTDTNRIPPESLERLQGLDVLILDGLRHTPHPTHFHLEAAVEVASQIQAKRTYFTHVSHDLEYVATNALLPSGMELAYDGLQIPLTGLLPQEP
jgi:phosphoribosyl 1,2-cyclic phosphate phosphodiesterase